MQRIRKLYNFVRLRKLQAILMLLLVLLSSGGAQMAYHICDDDGMHTIFNDCHEEASITEVSDCCKNNQECIVVDDCCTDAYFFALSPIPVAFTKFKLSLPLESISFEGCNSINKQNLIGDKKNHIAQLKERPPRLSRHQCDSSVKCVWII